jgi:hypothetical protein
VPDAEVCGGPVLFCGNFVDVPEIELGNRPCVVCRDNLISYCPEGKRGVKATFLELNPCDFQRRINLNAAYQNTVPHVVDIGEAVDYGEEGNK